MLNHGIHWQNCGQIVDIDLENDTTMIKWETTKKSESVSFEDLQKISIDDKSLRKCKPTDFFFHNQIQKFHQCCNKMNLC